MRPIVLLVRVAVIIGAWLIAAGPIRILEEGGCGEGQCPECYWTSTTAQAEAGCQGRNGVRNICWQNSNVVEGCCDEVATICNDDDLGIVCAHYGGTFPVYSCY